MKTHYDQILDALRLVAKHADFSNCPPEVEEVVDAALLAYDELTAARNELARLNGQTRWLCQCGGTPERTAELLAELESLRADKARLDWLDRRRRLEHGNCDRDSRSWYVLSVPTGWDYYSGGSDLPLRAAIDAAMKEGTP